MDKIASLFSCSAAFGQARGVSEARVSTLVFNDGKRLHRIRSGSDVGARQIDRAIQWFSDNWPAGTEWPADVPRPAPTADGEAA